jgi:hypothetical protein
VGPAYTFILPPGGLRLHVHFHGQKLGIVEPPEKDVGIEEQRHWGAMPKAAAMSSGRASKSSAMRTRPFH